MKTDRELLELAARAAGYEYGPSLYEATIDGKWHAYWNPIDDDGDALRLAVKLRLLHVMSGVMRAQDASGEYIADEYAATRRAIVRAAAAIGESMP